MARRARSAAPPAASFSPPAAALLPPPPPARPARSLLFYAITVISLNLLWGAAQERVGTHEFCTGSGDCAVFREIPCMNLLQALLATLVAYAAIAWQGAAFRRVGGALDLLPPSLSHTIASPVGYMAMGYIPFPLYILVSSCKLIPVLLVGVLLNPSLARPLQDYASALVMTEGVLLYSSAQIAGGAHGKEEASFYDTFLGFPVSGAAQLCVGVALTLSNLFLEGFTNAAQDRVNIRHKAAGSRPVPALQMMAECVARAALSPRNCAGR